MVEYVDFLGDVEGSSHLAEHVVLGLAGGFGVLDMLHTSMRFERPAVHHCFGPVQSPLSYTHPSEERRIAKAMRGRSVFTIDAGSIDFQGVWTSKAMQEQGEFVKETRTTKFHQHQIQLPA